MSEPIIQVENLSKRYRLGVFGYGSLQQDIASWWARVRGKEDPNAKIYEETPSANRDFWALKDVSFEVQRGEVLGIIGANGAGKSTLLKILSRITAPTSGGAVLRGRVASMLEVGTGFHPELTGRENVFLNGAILGMTKQEIEKKFDEIVDFSGIEKFIDSPVKRYSSGMYVRLAFAVAAHLQPEILLVDEVLAVGDAEFQKKCLGKMGDVAKAGRTVLFVSHNMAAINRLCTDSLLITGGRLEFIGETKQTIELYRNYIKPDWVDSSKEGKYRQEDKKEGIIGVEIRTSDANMIHRCLQPMTVLVTIKLAEPIESGWVTLHVINQDMEGVIHADAYDNESSWSGAGNHELRCIFPQLRLFQGHYHLRVFLVDSAVQKRIDYVECCRFSVVMDDVFLPREWTRDDGKYVEETEWELIGSP